MSEADIQRFWLRVRQWADGCWEWTGFTMPKRYGHMSINGRLISVHRLSYVMHFGAIPDGMNVLHRCDNPPCVNPDHLYVGTQKENLLDMREKGRMSSKLNDATARAILADVLQAKISQMEIADKYGVSDSLVSMVKHGQAWRHLTTRGNHVKRTG